MPANNFNKSPRPAPVQNAVRAAPVQSAVRAAPTQNAAHLTPIKNAVRSTPVQNSVRPAPTQSAARAVPVDKVEPVITKPDPSPYISGNPAVSSVTLFKTLSAYPNYGNPSRSADILYTGTRGAWDFEIPQFLLIPGRFRAQVVIRAVLDDHINVPVNRYSAKISINGILVHNGRLPLDHGTPAGNVFSNWGELIFNISNPIKSNRIVIENISAAGPNDWVGLDWIEFRQFSKQ